MIYASKYAKSNHRSRGKYYLAIVRSDNNKYRLSKRKLRKAAEAEAYGERWAARFNSLWKAVRNGDSRD